MTKDITMQFYEKMSNINDPLAFTVTNHLFVEHWIDRIIRDKTKRPSELNKLSFSLKLEMIYNLDLIPDGLYMNLKKMNQLRNNCAHNLNFDFSGADFGYDESYFLENSTTEGIPGVPVYLTHLKDDPLMNKLLWVCANTFVWLNNHAVVNLLMRNDQKRG